MTLRGKGYCLINRIELVEESKASQGDNMIKDHWHRAEDIFRLLLEVSVLIQLEANTTELGRMKTACAHSRLVFFFCSGLEADLTMEVFCR